jgi:hypothetical protein
MKEFYVKKDGDKITLTIREIKETQIQLDREDIQQLSSDLINFLDYKNSKEYYEAKQQALGKTELSKEMIKTIEESFGNRFSINPDGTASTKTKNEWIPSETELTTLKTKKNGK